MQKRGSASPHLPKHRLREAARSVRTRGREQRFMMRSEVPSREIRELAWAGRAHMGSAPGVPRVDSLGRIALQRPPRLQVDVVWTNRRRTPLQQRSLECSSSHHAKLAAFAVPNLASLRIDITLEYEYTYSIKLSRSV